MPGLLASADVAASSRCALTAFTSGVTVDSLLAIVGGIKLGGSAGDEEAVDAQSIPKVAKLRVYPCLDRSPILAEIERQQEQQN